MPCIIQTRGVLYTYSDPYASALTNADAYTKPYSNPLAYSYPNGNANPYALYRGDGTDLQQPNMRPNP